MPYSDPEQRRAYQRQWMSDKADRWRELSREAMRRWRQRHPEAKAEQNRAWRARRPELAKQHHRRSQQRHPETRRASWQAYRARRKAAPGSFTSTEWLLLMKRYDGRCAYCGTAGALQIEHRIPLSRGGRHSAENIVPACAPCNARKARLSDVEFRELLVGRWASKVD